MFDNNDPINHPNGKRPSLDVDVDVAAPRSPELVLVKKGQRFVFRCQPGEEASLLARLRELVDDPEVNLSWFDAAVLSHQVGEQLAHRLRGDEPTSK